MRPGSDVEAEAWVLQTDAGRALLAEVAAIARPGPADLMRWRRGADVDRVAAAVRLAEGRRRGVDKFARAGAMWLDPVGLEQATAEPVARHKARRFAESGATLVVDLCSGIGGDTLTLAEFATVLAVDLDPGMNRRARWNAGVYGVESRVAPIRARAEDFARPAGAFVHVDPDRRAVPGRSRAKDLQDYSPGPDFLRWVAREAPGGALKLGPASDFESLCKGPEFEVELVSLGGECKEATAWFGELVTCRRRATRLPGGASWTDRDADGPARMAPIAPPLAWAFAPDPTLGRAGLLDGFARAHGLARLAAGVDLLTGPARVDSPFLAGFEVAESGPLDLKRLASRVLELGLGPLEIKTRALDLTPESVRARLRPISGRPATLLLIGGPGPALALIAFRPDLRPGRACGAC